MKLSKVVLAAVLAVGTICYAQTVEEVITVFTDLDRVPDYNYSTIYIDNISASGAVEHMELNSSAVETMVLKIQYLIS